MIILYFKMGIQKKINNKKRRFYIVKMKNIICRIYKIGYLNIFYLKN